MSIKNRLSWEEVMVALGYTDIERGSSSYVKGEELMATGNATAFWRPGSQRTDGFVTSHHRFHTDEGYGAHGTRAVAFGDAIEMVREHTDYDGMVDVDMDVNGRRIPGTEMLSSVEVLDSLASYSESTKERE